MATPNTIRLRGGNQTDEALASGAITPGDLLLANSDGTYQRHSDASGNQDATFALENATMGKTVDDNWADGDTVTMQTFKRGERVYATLAASQTIVVGDYLESNGAGKLQKWVFDSTYLYLPNQIVGRAIEAVTTTGSVGRVKVQII